MRGLAATGHTAVYFSFDHDNATLLERLIAMEAAEIAGSEGVPLKRVREAFEARQRAELTLEERLAGTEAGVEELKDLSLELSVLVLAVVAAGPVAGKRMRVQDLRGSSTIAVPADVVIILNDKFDVVARHHLVYNLVSAERFKSWVILTIEKNRNGVDKVDLEFQKSSPRAGSTPMSDGSRRS